MCRVSDRLSRAAIAAAAWFVIANASGTMAQERLLTLDDGVRSEATFDIQWITATHCPAKITKGVIGVHSLTVSMDCINRPVPGEVTADFILFDETHLSDGWTVSSFDASAFGFVISDGSARVLDKPQIGSTRPRTRLRLRALHGASISMNLIIKVRFTPALPDCHKTLEVAAPRFVCTADDECVPPGSLCSRECGQRCIPK